MLDKLFKKKPKNYSIKVTGLNVSYGKKKVLNNIHFTINKKDVFGIIGLSGSGKSTLLKSLMGFINYKGLIDKTQDSIGYCPQEEAFFNELSLKENILLYGNMNSTSPNIALSRAQKLMNELMIKESLDKLAGELSGGQQKRLNIILSILHDPNTIILDEPFAGLDYMNRLLLWNFIKHLKRKGKTIVLTTHLLNEAQKNCNNLLIISKGKKFALGSISDLKRSLKFKQYMSIKFNYLSKENKDKIKTYCRRRNYWVLSTNERTISFGIPDVNARRKLLSMIKRLDVKYSVTEFRPPTLNELFMVSVK